MPSSVLPIVSMGLPAEPRVNSATVSSSRNTSISTVKEGVHQPSTFACASNGIAALSSTPCPVSGSLPVPLTIR